LERHRHCGSTAKRNLRANAQVSLIFGGQDQGVSAEKTDPEPVRPEVGPSWVVVTRFTTAVHVALVVALLLVTTRHAFAIRVCRAADVAVVLLTVGVALLVSWPSRRSRS
jgi:hypothetical protein